MIVPQYWAEARAQHKAKRKQITVRRFGWSDISEAEAQSMADRRVQEALQRLVAGEKLLRREPKIPYNGAEGVPIREEILSRQGDVIITRNSYGAHCLNTPNVLFADVDLKSRDSARTLAGCIGLVGVGLAIFIGYKTRWNIGAILCGVVVVLNHLVARHLKNRSKDARADQEKQSHERITAFSASHPDWHLRVYRTPNGFRLLAMHRTFSPDEPAVADCFSALGTDSVYVQMCRNQHCFRARLTAKPWRINIRHMRPQPGTWPVRTESMPLRQEWVQKYEAAAAGYASCKFIESLGSSTVDPQAQLVQELHDKESRATADLPMG